MIREIASLIKVAKTNRRERTAENAAEYSKVSEVNGRVTRREGKNTLIIITD